MSLNFYRRVAFGLSPQDERPQEPLSWALNQLNSVPDFLWKGSIPTEKELRKKYGEWVYGDREVLRKKFKNDKNAYRQAKDELRIKTGERYFELNEHAIRHYQTKYGAQPVFERFWLFWGNHFAISEKDFLAEFSTGPYQREVIRPNMVKTFEDMVQAVTTSWCMIHHLDNSESVGPNSKRGVESRDTINENHARELLELHTVSPKAGYSQEDVIQLAYIMTGWQHRWSKKNLETGNVWFNSEYHQRGKKNVLGKEYKKGRKAIKLAIKDLVNHPSCREFIATKLCRYLITDYPTPEMIAPVIKAWEQSDGYLPEVHKAAIKVAFEYNDKYRKFQNPENWWLTTINMSGSTDKYPVSEYNMNKFVFYHMIFFNFQNSLST